MFFNRNKQLFILGIIVIVLLVITLYFQQIKLEE